MYQNEVTGIPYMPGGQPSEFDGMVSDQVDKYKRLWWELCGKPVKMHGRTAGYFTKKKRESAADRFISRFIDQIEHYPESPDQLILWRAELARMKRELIEKTGVIAPDQAQFLLSSSILESTETFVNRAREYDSRIRIEDIGQAMRNVWIMNICQMLLGKPVRCTPSVFGYSMLYPYTDNFLDDAALDASEKRAYNIRFARRLSGEDFAPENELEEKIYGLVELIEGEYEREAFPGVFESLGAIHAAQTKSMLQQCADASPFTCDVLGISFEKGGASVLADAYLVKGDLTPEEIHFHFGYGLMLQLCDDLQDIRTDHQNRHHTLYSLLYNKWPADAVTDALFHLVDYVAGLTHTLGVKDPALFEELIRSNCRLMLFTAIAKNRRAFSRAYRKRVRGFVPCTRRYLLHANQRLLKRFKKLKPSYNGVDTEKIMLEALKA